MLSAVVLLFGFCGCSKKIDGNPNDRVEAQQTVDTLQLQVSKGEFAEAQKTIAKLEELKAVSARQMTEYLNLKAQTQIGIYDLPGAEATIAEVERGADDMSIHEVLLGRLAIAKGDKSAAKTHFSAARRINPKAEIPKNF